MPELRFSLRISSPAFAGSAPSGTKTVRRLRKGNVESKEVAYYPIDAAGIRVPSLRGLLAFWHRSLHGHVSCEELFAIQSRLFGSTSHGQGVSLVPRGRAAFESGKIEFESNYSPFLYLGYGPLQLLRKPADRGVVTSENWSVCRDAIKLAPDPRGPEFGFLARGTRSQMEALRRSLILLHLFGGVGARSRRAWGSVQVVMESLPDPSSELQLSDWLSETLRSAFAGLDRSPSGNKSQPKFSAFSAATEIRLTRVCDSYQEVMCEFYRRFQEVRLSRSGGVRRHAIAQTDYDLGKRDAGSDSVAGIPKRLAYGMPYQAKSRSGDWEIEYRLAGSDTEVRRASPLLLKVLRVSEKRYAGVCLFLKAEYFGSGAVSIGAKGKAGSAPFPGYSAVLEYLKNPKWTTVTVP